MDIRKDKIIEKIKNLVDNLQHKVKIKEVYIFGSFLTGEDYQDIDVALISDNFSGTRFIDMKLIIDSLKNYSSNFDLHPFNTGDFYDDRNIFAVEIREHGKNILELEKTTIDLC